MVQTVYPHGDVDIQNLETGETSKINGQRLNFFLELPKEVEEVFELYEPVYQD